MFEWGTRTYIFGVLNVTPDSFSGDGVLDRDAALAQALAMRAEGADVIDVGGESTRPGHVPVSLDDELRRIEPVLPALVQRGVVVSIDTRKAAVARRAIELGARVVNDVSGLSDPAMLPAIATSDAYVVLMDDRDVREASDPVGAVHRNLAALIERTIGAGVARGRLIVDPGFGFGKAPRENLAVLRELERFRDLGCPILVGTSRKSTIGKVLGGAAPNERLEGTAATVAIAIAKGADAVRVHDVRELARVVRMADAIVRA